MPPLVPRVRNKRARYRAYATRALADLEAATVNEERDA
jgi:folate-dependent tRNA-U54 methylase TrmFO/GidA